MHYTRPGHACDISLIGIFFTGLKQRDQYVSTSPTFIDPITIRNRFFLSAHNNKGDETRCTFVTLLSSWPACQELLFRGLVFWDLVIQIYLPAHKRTTSANPCMISCTPASYTFLELNNGTVSQIIPLKTYRRMDAQLFIFMLWKYTIWKQNFSARHHMPIMSKLVASSTHERDITKTWGTGGFWQGSSLRAKLICFGPCVFVWASFSCFVCVCPGSNISDFQTQSACLVPWREIIALLTKVDQCKALSSLEFNECLKWHSIVHFPVGDTPKDCPLGLMRAYTKGYKQDLMMLLEHKLCAAGSVQCIHVLEWKFDFRMCGVANEKCQKAQHNNKQLSKLGSKTASTTSAVRAACFLNL